MDLLLTPPVVRQSPSPSVQQDRQLVDRCVAGEVGAWDELYHGFHRGLLASIQRQLGSQRSDENLVEEIAARVWYALVADGGRRLDRFDVDRGCRLSTYLAIFAKSEALTLLRSECRRRRRERIASRPESDWSQGLQGLSRSELRGFVRGLTPREHEFLFGCLLCTSDKCSTFSDAARWQLASRIRSKLHQFLGAGTDDRTASMPTAQAADAGAAQLNSSSQR